MQKKRLVIWSSFEDYEAYRPQLILEEVKGNIEIAAVMFLDEDVVKVVDRYMVIKVEELLDITFDYIVGFGEGLYEDMVRIVEMLRISKEKLIPGRVFNLPNFDFSDYLCVKEQRVSIFADNCWGGYTYHSLGMPFYSPFINLFVKQEKFVKLANNLEGYLSMPLEFLGMTQDDTGKIVYPLCTLGDVEVHCNHYGSFEEARSYWERRAERINWNNILIKMSIENEEHLEAFRSIHYPKIGFSKIPCNDVDVIDLSGMVNSSIFTEKYEGQFWKLVNWQAMSDRVDLKYYNVLKLLLGEENYRRTML